MDLVNQYLRAVAALLPRAQRDDITAELRDIILSRIEAREAALGRPLSEDEIEEELRAVGHPILVAARYRQEPQHLVGPALYPYWMFAVKIAIAFQLIFPLAMLILRILSNHDLSFSLGHAIGQAVTGSITLIGIATVVAWAVERGKLHIGYLDNWRVRDLKVLEYAGWGLNDLLNHFRQAQPAREAAADAAEREPQWNAWLRPRRRSPVGKAIFAITFGTVFLLWWVGVIPLTLLAPADGLNRLNAGFGTVAGLNLNDLHTMLFWPVLLFIVAIFVRGTLNLIFPAAVRLRAFLAVLMGAGMLLFCFWLWTLSPIASAIQVDNAADLMARLPQVLHQKPVATLAPLITLWVAVAVFAAAAQIVRGLWEMLVPTRQGD